MTEYVCCICGVEESKTSRFYRSSKHSEGKPICNKHALQIQRHGKILDSTPPRRKKFEAEWCCDICKDTNGVQLYSMEGDYQGKLLCSKHRSQVQKYGEILTRTRFDKNEIIEHDNYAEVLLYNNKHEVVAKSTIDLDDVDKIKMYKWSYDSLRNYARTNDKRVYLAMHQLIMGTKGTKHLVDHIDRDGLNNRRSNLRLADKSLNATNIGLREDNKSGVTGVSFCNSVNKWRAYINVDGKRLELGYFENKDDAIIKRLNAELTYYPDLPPQKHLFEKYNIGSENDVQ